MLSDLFTPVVLNDQANTCLNHFKRSLCGLVINVSEKDNQQTRPDPRVPTFSI